MARPEGVFIEDLGTEPKTDADVGTLSDSISEKPTDSHALAAEAPVVEGTDPADHGWNREPEHVARLVDGLSNEDFWLLVRRFNHQVFYLKETSKIPPSPRAGVLGATDAVTGAPENLKGEAVENEASNFVTGVVGIAVNTLTAQDPKAEPENQKGEEHPTDSMPQPNEATTLFAVAKDRAAGVGEPSHDKTKYPMETIMWSKMLPLLRLLHFTSDTWERIANALDPTPPFSREKHRIRLAGLLSSMLMVSIFFSAASIVKATTFIVGVVFFSDPLIKRSIHWLDRQHPGWTQLLRPEAHILHGVPNNAQLAITLLRLGEAHGAPFPPPPSTDKNPPKEPLQLSDSDIDAKGSDAPLGATHEEINHAKAADPDRLDQAGGPDSEIQDTGGHKTSGFLAFVKGTAKLGIKAALQADKLRAKAGRASAKNRLGAVPANKGAGEEREGPTEFSARWEGKVGYVRVANGPDGVVSFDDDWRIRVADVTELKKHSGMGMKTKLAVGWATERDVADGIEIKDRRGDAYVLSAVPLRDQLFNRLCAMGGQKWEVW
ncbi:hypothetical protein C8A03DRAFT_16312 [Achaetomium macrosporum]|uniref:Uncharacterized protein n=1 Tax=Achaetomium macrosporum TaxID=79813 RepID=A0AAN7C8T8_9PEZI|nr:hypothetical protein C8A03DRAFT_16312 [Achaetomium macrosporum]